MNKAVQKHIDEISINGFKSVRSLTLSDCKRINVLIGKPNVGKSNILEALALFDVPYLISSSDRSLNSLVRVENMADIFHNGAYSNPIEINAGSNNVTIQRSTNNGLTMDIECSGEKCKYSFSSSLNLTTKKEPLTLSDILVYFFPKKFVSESSGLTCLMPPSGANLMETVASLPDLKENIAGIFSAYGLKMVFDSGSRQIKAMKENGHDMFLIPFASLADSFQRLVFYKAAIESNDGKVICFEEPEAHTFPPYISNVVNDILDSKSNQFFITTHSPYVISSLLESAGNDLAVYVVEMDNGSTIANRLTEEQLQSAYDNGMDMFYNIEAYLTK